MQKNTSTPPIPTMGRLSIATDKGKGLQIQITVEDEGAFTTPWSTTVTLRRALDEGLELVGADNTRRYPRARLTVPTADRVDF